jgi:GTP cyclohydrolase I
MYVKEVFNGLNPANRPEARTFNNNYDYSDVVIEKNIQVNSFCEHHFLPFIGKAHVAYISKGKVIGLSKINRLGRLLLSKAAGSGTINPADCRCDFRCNEHRRCGRLY